MKLWLALAAVAALLILVFVPPLVSLSRYKNRITQLMSTSFGRPVHLSSVELRILPRPSFVLTDLNVEEDPAYGAEPVLHANTVTASIWLFPLWRGRLQISRVSVDEASVNLVRTGAGHWNLDSLLRTATTRSDSEAGANIPFPYIEATNSRINIKNGVEKLPFSVVNADLSFWQDNPGEWRIRLRGQPARTDVSLDLPDTGILRLEGSMRRASALQEMPIHADLDWKEAQLGQLSRLLLGSDEGWRGDLTGELHIDGTADAAKVTSRLRASGVHRAEFAPASPIDFDATCNFLYHYSDRSLENLLCNSPIGDGRVRLTGGLTGRGVAPHLTLEMDRVPAQVGLDALRTMRNSLDPTLGANGSISGQISYTPETVPVVPSPAVRGNQAKNQSLKAQNQTAKVPGPLSGSLIVTGLRLSGDGLSKPIQTAKINIDPAPGDPPALAATIPILLGANTPLTLTARLSLHGYQAGVHGAASLARLREVARVAGISRGSILDQIDGQIATVDINAEGPWLSSIVPLPQSVAPAASTEPPASPTFVIGTSDRVSGTVSLRDVVWKSGFLANPVQVSAATLHFENSALRWDPIAFTYGPVKGTATLAVPLTCEGPAACPPQFSLHFGTLDAAELQAALLGARQTGTVISNLIARLRPSSAAAWPSLQGTVRADSLILTPITLNDASVALNILPTGAEITSFDGALLGGHVHGEGSITPGEKPTYKLSGDVSRLDAGQVGRLLGMTWSGEGVNGSGEVEMSGFTDKDLAASAKGTLHFDWSKGSVASVSQTGLNQAGLPPALARFDRWTADAAIADGALTLKQNQIQRGARKFAVEGSAVFGDPPAVRITSSPDVRAARR